MKNRRGRPAKQLSFLPKVARFFGGILLYGRRKRMRPLSSKDAIHLVIRSLWATGATSFLNRRNKNAIEFLIAHTAKLYGVRVYRLAICSNHCHLIIKITNRDLYATFIRVLTSKIASHVMQGRSFKRFVNEVFGSNFKQEEPHGIGQQFFQFRPFTRVLHWGRDYETCCAYVSQNTLEALGFVPHRPREDRYSKWIRDTIEDPATCVA